MYHTPLCVEIFPMLILTNSYLSNTSILASFDQRKSLIHYNLLRFQGHIKFQVAKPQRKNWLYLGGFEGVSGLKLDKYRNLATGFIFNFIDSKWFSKLPYLTNPRESLQRLPDSVLLTRRGWHFIFEKLNWNLELNFFFINFYKLINNCVFGDSGRVCKKGRG